jgi:hypothetical protein
VNILERLQASGHCKRAGEVLYVMNAEDTTGRDRRPLTSKERLTVAQMEISNTEHLENRVELAVGMEAMVTQNISTDASLANGSRGVVVDIVLDPHEGWHKNELDDEGVLTLMYPPAMVLFKPYQKPVIEPLPGLLPTQIPVFPFKANFHIGGKKKGTKITRHQMPLTQGYVFTDHKSQGQTLENVVVDIGKLSCFPINAFAAYVALSRSRGRHKIRLLRDFDSKLFTTHPCLDLRDEDQRLEVLAEKTKERWCAGFYKYDY